MTEIKYKIKVHFLLDKYMSDYVEEEACEMAMRCLIFINMYILKLYKFTSIKCVWICVFIALFYFKIMNIKLGYATTGGRHMMNISNI